MKTILFLVLMVVPISLWSQEVVPEIEPIQTDRPDQTETPALVPAGMFQMENGFSFEKTDDVTETFTGPSSLLKYGVNENFELRLILEYTNIKTGDVEISGINPVLVGFKAKIAEENGMIPKTSFIAHMSIPKLASDSLKTEFYAPEFRLVMQHTLSERLSLSYNLGAEWDGETPEPTFIYTLATGISLTDKLGSYLELYGFAPQNDKVQHNFDGGLTYLISNNFMIDASGGFGLTDNAPEYFGALGFSFRL